MATTMTVKGQVTIPKAVRDVAGLQPGCRVEVFNEKDGTIVVRAASGSDGDASEHYSDMMKRFERACAIRDAQRDPANPWQNMARDEFMSQLRDDSFPFEDDRIKAA